MAPKLTTNNSPLITILGPTASGKSELAIRLAQKYGGEIVCADSRTIYRGLDIGTAKPSQSDRDAVTHHLIDVVNPDEVFNVADFQRLAKQCIDDIRGRGKLPIMVGGSGLYIDAVLYDFEFSGGGAPRNDQNPRHLGKDVPRQRQGLRPATLVVGLQVDREQLRRRIEKRVDRMIDSGLIEETSEAYKNYPHSKALLAPGYKAFKKYLENKTTMAEAKQAFVRGDMHLARRQMTWFRRNKDIVWVHSVEQVDELVHTFLLKFATM